MIRDEPGMIGVVGRAVTRPIVNNPPPPASGQQSSPPWEPPILASWTCPSVTFKISQLHVYITFSSTTSRISPSPQLIIHNLLVLSVFTTKSTKHIFITTRTKNE